MYRAPFTLNWGRFGVSRQVGLYAKSSASSVSLDTNSSSPAGGSPNPYSTLSRSHDRLHYPATSTSSGPSWRSRTADCTLVHARMSTPSSLFSTTVSSGLSPSSSSPGHLDPQAVDLLPQQVNPPPQTELRQETRDEVASMTEQMLKAKRAGKYLTVLKLFRKVQSISHQQAPLLAFNIVFDTFSLGSFPTPPPALANASLSSSKPSPASLPLQDLLTCYGELIRSPHISPAPFTYTCLLKALAMRCRAECRALIHAAEDQDASLSTDHHDLPPSTPSSSSSHLIPSPSPIPLCESNDTVRSLIDILTQVYNAMQKRDFVRDIGVNTHNQVLRSAAEAGDLKLAMRVFDALEACQNQQPNEHTYSFLILALGRSGETMAARRCYEAFLSGSRSPQACTFVANHLIDALTQRGGPHLDEARRLIDVDMPASGVPVDVVGLNTLITAYGREKRVQEAWELTKSMAHPSTNPPPYPPPDIVTIRTLLSAAIRVADVPVAYWAWKELSSTSLSPSRSSIDGKKDPPSRQGAVLGIRRTVRLLRLMLHSREVDAICGVLGSIRSPSALHSGPSSKAQDHIGSIQSDLCNYLSHPDTNPSSLHRVLTSLGPLISGLRGPQLSQILHSVQRSLIPFSSSSSSSSPSSSSSSPTSKLDTERMLIISRWTLSWSQPPDPQLVRALATACVHWAQEDPDWLSQCIHRNTIPPQAFSSSFIHLLLPSSPAIAQKEALPEEERIRQARLLLSSLFRSRITIPNNWWTLGVLNPLKRSADRSFLQSLSSLFKHLETSHLASISTDEVNLVTKREDQLKFWNSYPYSLQYSPVNLPSIEKSKALIDWLFHLGRTADILHICTTIRSFPEDIPSRSAYLTLANSTHDLLEQRNLEKLPSSPITSSNPLDPWGYGNRGSHFQARRLLAIEDPTEAVNFGWAILRAAAYFRDSNIARYRAIPPPSPHFVSVLLGRIVQSLSLPTSPPLEPRAQADRVGKGVLECMSELKQWKKLRLSPVAYSTTIGACLRPASSPEFHASAMELYEEFRSKLPTDKEGSSVYGVVAQAAALRGDQTEALRILGHWKDQSRTGAPANRNILRVAAITNGFLSPRDVSEAEAFVRHHEPEAGGHVEEAWTNVIAGYVLEGREDKARSLWREIQERNLDEVDPKSLRVSQRLKDPWDQTVSVLITLFGEDGEETKRIREFIITLKK
ncbi:MAG: hypothetical protein DHS80DRAFT_32306 [Piptocephalis tieghemiana]|nr:MAG: hypothetical protein DHS80DRAFT_32306 [Piptocephalis tieghemiana]